MSDILVICQGRFVGAVAPFTGKIIKKNGLGVLERGYNFLQNGILNFAISRHVKKIPGVLQFSIFLLLFFFFR